MSAEVYQVLFESKTFWPRAARPDGLAVINTRHDSVVVFDHVVDGQHPKSELIGLKFLGNCEVGWNEWNDLSGCVHSQKLVRGLMTPNVEGNRRADEIFDKLEERAGGVRLTVRFRPGVTANAITPDNAYCAMRAVGIGRLRRA